MILALAIPMAWYLGLTYRQPLLRWICRGYVPLCVVAIGLTGSRGGVIATTVWSAATVSPTATSIDHIIEEIAVTRITERGATRADDKFSEAAMEDRKKEGYF